MSVMSTNDPLERLYVRVTPEVRRVLKRTRGKLLGEPLTEDVTQEELIASSWLWMATQEPAKLAVLLAPFLAQYRAAVDEVRDAAEAQEPEPTPLRASGKKSPMLPHKAERSPKHRKA